MLTHAVSHRLADAGRLASARKWRTHAELLRDSAEAPALTTGQRTVLLRDAQAAERQAGRRLRAMRTRGHNLDEGPRPSAGPDRPCCGAARFCSRGGADGRTSPSFTGVDPGSVFHAHVRCGLDRLTNPSQRR